MRVSLLVAALLACALAVPVASAEPQARLALDAPTQAPAGVEVPVSVTLELSGIECRRERWVAVKLGGSAEGTQATIGTDQIAFRLDEADHSTQAYSSTATTWVRAANAGTVTLVAQLTDALNDCIVGPGLAGQRAQVAIRFGEEGNTPPPAPEDTTNQSAPTSEAPPLANLTSPPRSNGIYVGNYTPPPAESREAPAAPFALALAALAALALLGKR